VWVATHRCAPLNQVSVWLGTVEKLSAVWIVPALLAALATRRRAAETDRRRASISSLVSRRPRLVERPG